MFQSDTHLPHVLAPAAYSSTEQFVKEREDLLWSSWHCLATTAEFSRRESPETFTLLGVPLRIHRKGTKVEITTDKTSIESKQRLKNLSRKVEIRQEHVGQLVFVSLDGNGPSLSEHLGGEQSYLESLFDHRWAPCLSNFRELPCNWKLLMENVLENYHLEEVHTSTFKHYPPPEACEHSMCSRGSSYVEVLPPSHSHLENNTGLVSRILNVRPDPAYRHVVIYPNFTAGRMGLFNWAHSVFPVTPEKAINAYYFFELTGECRGGVGKITKLGLHYWGRHFFQTLLNEDAAVLPGVQAGMTAPSRPNGGLISAREERIFHFQNHIAERVGVPEPRSRKEIVSKKKWSEIC